MHMDRGHSTWRYLAAGALPALHPVLLTSLPLKMTPELLSTTLGTRSQLSVQGLPFFMALRAGPCPSSQNVLSMVFVLSPLSPISQVFSASQK